MGRQVQGLRLRKGNGRGLMPLSLLRTVLTKNIMKHLERCSTRLQFDRKFELTPEF